MMKRKGKAERTITKNEKKNFSQSEKKKLDVKFDGQFAQSDAEPMENFHLKVIKEEKRRFFYPFFFLDTKVTDEIKRIMKSGISTNIANPSVGLTKDPTSEFDGRMIPKIND